MISLSVKAMYGQAEQYGKKISELQTGISVSGTEISGTLNKVESFEGFGDSEASSPGHYLALEFSADGADSIKTKVAGGSGKETDCTSDKFCIYRIKDASAQKIEVTASGGGQSVKKTYGLSGLTLA